MKRPGAMGLSWKLALTLLGVSLFLTGLILLTEWSALRLRSETMARNFGDSLAVRLNESLSLPVQAHQREVVRRIVNAEFADPALRSMTVFIPGADTVYAAAPLGTGDVRLFKYTFNLEETEGGVVTLQIDEDAPLRRLREDLPGNLTRILIVVFFMSIVTGGVLNRFLVRPMDRLRLIMEAIRKVIRGGYASEELKADHVAAVIHRLPGHFSEIDQMSSVFEELTRAVYDRQISLERTQENLSSTLNAMGDGVIVIDAQGNITLFNPAAERICGIRAQNALKSHHSQIIRLFSPDGSELPSILEQTLLEQKVGHLDEWAVLKAHDNHERRIDGIVSPLYGKNAELTGAVMVIHDHTEQYALEMQMRNVQKMEVVGRLAGGLAHDLNNMLCGISGATDLLLVSGLSAQQKSHVLLIQRSMTAVSGLVKQLLTLSRNASTEHRDIDLNAVIKDAAALIRPAAANVTFKLKLYPGSLTVCADALQLQNVFINLGINARDAMEDSGTLLYATRVETLQSCRPTLSGLFLQPGLYAVVSVNDTGGGIAPAVLERMFDPFFTTKEKGKGTGLGLAMVYGSVKEHGGAVEVRTRMGEGTVFEIWLPLKSAIPDGSAEVVSVLPPLGLNESSEPEAPQPLTLGVSLSEATSFENIRRVLIVDDDALIRKLLCAMLDALGIASDEAADAAAALQFLEKGDYDLLMTDFNLPEKSGSALIEELRRSGNAIPAILLSGFDAEDERIAPILHETRISFLKKPFGRADLKSALEVLFPPTGRKDLKDG